MPISALEALRNERVALLRSLRRPRYVRLESREVLGTARGRALLEQQGAAYARFLKRARPPPPPMDST
eukprot:15477909-Alexandrium_andersonii.AAC.1